MTTKRILLFRSLLVLILAIFAIETIMAQEAYALLSDDNTKLTFYYDNQMENRNGMSVSGTFNTPTSRGWHSQRYDILKVEFDTSFNACHSITSTRYWFCECKNLIEIVGIEFLHTENVTDMRGMFQDCYNLTSLDVSGFNTEKVETMYNMFGCCRKLESVDVSGFNTSNVKNMYRMFSTCENLKDINLSNFNTENVTNMSGLFMYCKTLTNLDLSGFITSKVTTMEEMFRGCANLQKITFGNFNTASVTKFNYMFELCESLTNIDLTSFNTENATTMMNMFRSCSSLEELDVSGFKTPNVQSMEMMFHNCSKLSSIDLSSFNTAAVINMSGMFNFCTELTTIYAGDEWSTQNEQYGNTMFDDCKKLVGGKGTIYDASHIRLDYARIDGGADAPGYFTKKEPVQKWTEGDLNHDGEVNSADVVALIALMMYPGSGDLNEGDLNHDGVVNAADVVRLTNMILTQK